MKKQVKRTILHVLNERKAYIESTLSNVGYSFMFPEEIECFSANDQVFIIELLNERNEITNVINYLNHEKTNLYKSY